MMNNEQIVEALKESGIRITRQRMISHERKYGYNIKSQLLKLLIMFPAASALAAWICTLF